MKFIYSGLESSGKSLRLAEKISELVKRNSKWFSITGVRRPILSNLKLASHVEECASDLQVPIVYWKDLMELVTFTECDVIIDEVGNYFDARKWADLPLDVRKWLTQGAKMGVEIYGTAQDFAQVDKAFRRLTTDLEHIVKVIGSPRPSATRPPVKYIWGICMVRRLNPRVYKEDQEKFDSSGLPSFFFIQREFCEMYNTGQQIELSTLPKLKHAVQYCEHFGSDDPNHICDFKKVIHS